MIQTHQLTEHGDGVRIHWTMMRGQRKVLAATIERPHNYQPKARTWKHQPAGKPKN